MNARWFAPGGEPLRQGVVPLRWWLALYALVIGLLCWNAASAHAAAAANSCTSSKKSGQLTLACHVKALKLFGFSVIASKSPVSLDFQLACDNPTEKSAAGGIGGPAYAVRLTVAHSYHRAFHFNRPKTGALVCRAILTVKVIKPGGVSAAAVHWTAYGNQTQSGLSA